MTNSQSLNRYAYVRNNPTTLTDPLGLSPACLFRSGGLVHARVSTGGAGCNGVYDGGDGGASIDGGGGMPPGLGGLLGGSGESYGLCPDNACTVPGIDSQTGQPAILEYTIASDGTWSYLSGYDLSLGLNTADGTFLSDAQYGLYQQITYANQISAQCGTVGRSLFADAPAGSGATVKSCDPNSIQGAHANFPIDCGDWLGCAGRWAGGLHIEGNPTVGFWGHNDTASYYIGPSFNWDTFSLWNLFQHGGVDVLGGNTVVNMFPH